MDGPQGIPINARFGDDFVAQLVVIATADTMSDVARKVASHSVGKRIRPQHRDMIVYYEGRPVPKDATVAEIGIAPFHHIVVDYL